MQAHYADAITIGQMKKEQSRISREVIDAEAQLDAVNKTLGPIEDQVRDAMEYFQKSPAAYLTADDEGRREMNHTWWNRVFVDDDGETEPVMAGLAATLLADDLPVRLRQEVEAMKDADVEKDFWAQIRNESKSPNAEHVGVGTLAQGSTPGSNLNDLVHATAQPSNQMFAPDTEGVGGSNVITLVGVEGLEPPTLSVYTRCSSQLS